MKKRESKRERKCVCVFVCVRRSELKIKREGEREIKRVYVRVLV